MQNTYAQQNMPSPTNYTEELGVFFDSRTFKLLANYNDEISAFRAKRNWMAALEEVLLLTAGSDFIIESKKSDSDLKTTLTCHFSSASARYAFWKLTNNQAAEAQYIIETAHIPNSKSHQDLVIAAPDLKRIDEPQVLVGRQRQDSSLNILEWLKSLGKKSESNS